MIAETNATFSLSPFLFFLVISSLGDKLLPCLSVCDKTPRKMDVAWHGLHCCYNVSPINSVLSMHVHVHCVVQAVITSTELGFLH